LLDGFDRGVDVRGSCGFMEELRISRDDPEQGPDPRIRKFQDRRLFEKAGIDPEGVAYRGGNILPRGVPHGCGCPEKKEFGVALLASVSDGCGGQLARWRGVSLQGCRGGAAETLRILEKKPGKGKELPEFP